MLHACVQRFDVTENLENLTKFFRTKLDLAFWDVCLPTCLPPSISNLNAELKQLLPSADPWEFRNGQPALEIQRTKKRLPPSLPAHPWINRHCIAYVCMHLGDSYHLHSVSHCIACTDDDNQICVRVSQYVCSQASSEAQLHKVNACCFLSVDSQFAYQFLTSYATHHGDARVLTRC